MNPGYLTPAQVADHLGVRRVGRRYVRACGCLQAGDSRSCYRFRNGRKASQFKKCECECHDKTPGKGHRQVYRVSPVVYFVRCTVTGRIKIGTSTCFMRRFAGLCGHSPTELEVVGLLDGHKWDEKELHGRFKKLRLHGEWFEGGPELTEFISTHAGIPAP